MNESKKMKKSITLPFDENSRRLIIILVVLLFITGITKSSQFLNVGNVQSIGKQLTEYGLMSLGMGICMLSGGIDLSTVYIANLCGISAGLIIQSNTSGVAGINVKKTTLCCYMISGILSAVAGLVSLSRLNSAKADFGTSYTMQTILVAVLGGINPDGGFGNIPGIAFAVIILQTLSSYLNQFPAISNYYRDMIWGIALLAVLVFNIYISKRRAKKAASK